MKLFKQDFFFFLLLLAVLYNTRKTLRIPEWARLEVTTGAGPTSLLKKGHPAAQGMELCREDSGISPVRETPNPLWSLFRAQSLHREVLPRVQVELVGISSCLFLLPTEQGLLHPLGTPFGYLYTLMRSPLLSLLGAEHSQLLQPFLLREAPLPSPLWEDFCPLLFLLQHLCVPPILRSPELGTALWVCLSRAEQRDRILFWAAISQGLCGIQGPCCSNPGSVLQSWICWGDRKVCDMIFLKPCSGEMMEHSALSPHLPPAP